MPEVVLAVLKYLFLLLIFLFLARAVKAMFLEIYGPSSQRSSSQTNTRTAQKAKAGKPPERVVVTSAEGKPRAYDISNELIIGRDGKCHVVIEDAYASQVHARLFVKDEALFIEDMGSTNGTYLNKRKVTSPLPVNRGDKARIGKTEMEFRR